MPGIETKNGAILRTKQDVPEAMLDAAAETYERTGKAPEGFTVEGGSRGVFERATDAVRSITTPMFAPAQAMRNLPAGASATSEEQQAALQTAQDRGQLAAEAIVPQDAGQLAKMVATAGAGPVLGAAGVTSKYVPAIVRASIPALVDSLSGNLGIGTGIETVMVGGTELAVAGLNKAAGRKFGEAAIKLHEDKVAADMSQGVSLNIPLLNPHMDGTPQKLQGLFASKEFTASKAQDIIGKQFTNFDEVVANLTKLKTGRAVVDTRPYPNLANIAGEVTGTQTGTMGAFTMSYKMPSVEQIQQKLRVAKSQADALYVKDPTPVNLLSKQAVDMAEREYMQYVGTLEPRLPKIYTEIKRQYAAASQLHDMLGAQPPTGEYLWRGSGQGARLKVQEAQEIFGRFANDVQNRGNFPAIEALSGGTPLATDVTTNFGVRAGLPPIGMGRGYVSMPVTTNVTTPVGRQPGTMSPVPAELLELSGAPTAAYDAATRNRPQ